MPIQESPTLGPEAMTPRTGNTGNRVGRVIELSRRHSTSSFVRRDTRFAKLRPATSGCRRSPRVARI